MTGKKLFGLRVNYSQTAIDENSLPPTPFKLFTNWFDHAIAASLDEPNAMLLATTNEGNAPSVRTVLLKEFSETSFEFYTNYNSRKGNEIAKNPNVTLTFLWLPLQRQVIIKGIAEKTSKEKSEAYFKLRPSESCISVWASEQSKTIDNKQILFDKVNYYKELFKGKEIPCPDFWGGYSVIPYCFEFWQGGKDRLHDRFVYELINNEWYIKRLSP
ncbi:MAG: pyridoxamine 5'-phosphate oxidase [Bacteroidales bacterium]|nr:pyridoxamine 5'-phosphate oxidase [Bacteroidales bacterium]